MEYDSPRRPAVARRRGGAVENEDAGAPPPPARGEPTPAAASSRPTPRQSASTPLVVDGVMYLATMYNRVVALDSDTGKEIWVKDIGHTPSTRGLAYWPGGNGILPQLVFGTGDGSSLLVSLNAKTGEFTPGSAPAVGICAWRGEKFRGPRRAVVPPALKHLAITGNHSQWTRVSTLRGRRLGSAAAARVDVSYIHSRRVQPLCVE